MPQSFSWRSAQTVAVLAVTQLIGWGTSFDMLGVMGRIIAPDLGLPNEIAFAGLTLMMIVSAFAGPVTGRWLARYGAARVLASASVAFAVGLTLLAMTHGVVLYAIAWVVIGIGGALGLSAPCYAAVVEREGGNAKRIIAILLLFTGLSATIFWPVLTALSDTFGWRNTYLICAALQILICLPLHLLALPKPMTAPSSSADAQQAAPPISPQRQRKAFLLIAVITTLSTFVTFGIAPSLLEIFRQAGASPAFALQLGSARGFIAISARFVDMLLGKRGNPLLSAAIGIGLMLASFLILLAIGPSMPLLISFTLLYSFGSGVMTVARALLPLAFFSSRDFGRQSARLSMPQNFANAAAPVIYTAILDHAGSGAVILTCAVLAGVALVLVGVLGRLARGDAAMREHSAAGWLTHTITVGC